MTNQESSKPIQEGIKIIIRYAPFGGSLFALGSLVKDSQWVQAIVTVFPTVATTIWAAYSKAFLDRLTEIYSEEGKKGADTFKRFTDSLAETIKWTLAATDEKYLKCQSYPCQDYQIEGLTQSFIPQLEEVFVPLAFDATGEINYRDFLSSPRNNPNLSEAESNIIKIWDLLKNGQKNRTYRRLLIKSQGGYGKTTLLRHLTYLYTQKRQPKNSPKLLPILLRLRKWQEKIDQENSLDLSTLIEKHHLPSLPEGNSLKIPSNWAKNNLKNGKLLILWDGFDEVKPEWRESVSQWLGQQMSQYPNSFFILTSRPKGYNEGYSSEHKPFATLFIKPFNRQQIKDFVERWYLCQESFARAGRKTPDVIEEANRKAANLLQQLDQREELADLATNPLLLNMIAKIHRYYPSEQLPQRRTELYQEIFRLQLGDRPLFRKIEMLFSASDSQKILQQLALFMVQENKSTLDDNQLKQLVQQGIDSLGESGDSDKFIEQIEQVSELLVKRDDYYEFAHLSFQNYLAAQEIQETHQEKLILTHWPDSDIWKETTRLYAAQLRNPSSFIRSLIQFKNLQATSLAYECLKETSRQLDPDVKAELETVSSTVQDARYQKLEQLLKNQQFKDADQETYRLMIETLGKEQGQWFDPEDFDTFPCDDLRTLDQLWVKYSNGKFGFSVQKKIYMDDLGGTRQYNQKIWREFCDRVGWRKGGDYVRYSDLTFELLDTTPVGHLPLMTTPIVTDTDLFPSSSLAQRLVNCNISPRASQRQKSKGKNQKLIL